MSIPVKRPTSQFNVVEDHWGFKAVPPSPIELWFDANGRAILKVMNHVVGGEEIEVTFDTDIDTHIDTTVTPPPFVAPFNQHADIEFKSKPNRDFDVYIWVRSPGAGNRFRARADSDPRVNPKP